MYDALGIDLSTAVRMFLKRSVMVNGVPFNMTLPKNDFKAERAARALQELSNTAMENGTSEMTLEEINAEIEAVRKKNRGRPLMQYYAVIDTNVLVSAMLKFQSIPGQIVKEALLGTVIPLLCDEIVAEYREVLARPKFKFDQETIDVFIDGIVDRGIFVDAVSIEEVIPDPKDIVFYEVVTEGRREYDEAYLVTGNIKHFPVKSFVVTPKEMADIINSRHYLH